MRRRRSSFPRGSFLPVSFRRARATERLRCAEEKSRRVRHGRVKKGTGRRSLTFAVAYQKILAVFIPIVIIAAERNAEDGPALVKFVNPLTLQALIDNGILTKDADLVIWLAILIAVLALVDEALVLTERRISAHIGESLIYDGRSMLFRHIQRMSLAFFIRSQTGALVSRLNNDVTVAQQAFIDLLPKLLIDLLPNLVGNLVAVVSIGVSGLRREESRRVR